MRRILVFRVMGGYVFATDILMVTLAATSFRDRQWLAVVGTLIGGVASIGCMVIVNFALGLDHKWALRFIALVWASSLVLSWLDR